MHVFIWHKFFPDYASRMSAMSRAVTRDFRADPQFTLVPKE